MSGPKNQNKMFLFLLYILLYYFLGKINILKNYITFAHLIKGTVLRRALWGTFPTRNRLLDPKSVFSQTLLFLWFFIISYNNYSGNFKLRFYKFLFLVHRPVAISVATDGNSIGDARESNHFFFFLCMFNWVLFC